MPFFFKTKQAALLYLYTILNFIIFAIYVSYTNETLRYIDIALVNVNLLKVVFKNTRLKD